MLYVVEHLLVKFLVAITGLSLLVIVHEGGHYLAARACGMRVLRFSIGFGPTLARWQPKGSPTVFQIGLLPFLAYVQIAGMNPQEDVDDNDPELFRNKSFFARMVTIAAGPFANYLAASAIIFSMAMGSALPSVEPTSPMTVEEVVAGSPAAKAGLKAGDVIVEGEGKPIATVDDLIAITAPRANKPTTYIVERGGQRLPPLSITPADSAGRGQIGVSAQMREVYQELSFKESVENAIVVPYRMTKMQIGGLADLFERRTTEGVGGPVMMGKMVADAAQKGVPYFLSILAAISIALGWFNLLPIPALDGGRMVFMIFNGVYETITGTRANERYESLVHAFFIILLLGMMVAVTFRDIRNILG
ncbi:MAG: M50 family metallopeptidase [Polyangiales bacterium]